jgi:hypothetical protein
MANINSIIAKLLKLKYMISAPVGIWIKIYLNLKAGVAPRISEPNRPLEARSDGQILHCERSLLSPVVVLGHLL